MIGNSEDFMHMFIRHERNIMRLYEVFAECFPAKQDLWRGMAADKQQHIKMLDEISAECALDQWLLQENRLTPQGMKFAEKYIENQAEKAKNGKLSPSQSFAIARDIENALVEKQFSRIGDLTAENLMATLINISGDTQRHLKTIIQAYEAEPVSG
jgi:hypothetical protein